MRMEKRGEKALYWSVVDAPEADIALDKVDRRHRSKPDIGHRETGEQDHLEYRLQLAF
jgi:hypothetical protein